MSESIDRVRPGTRVLKRLIAAALEQQKPGHNGTEPRALLLLEPNCNELPAALVEDSTLEPVDKVIWLVLMLRARRGDGVTSMPVYRKLARSANVASRQTASQALSILRCRRWLTVCQTSWRKNDHRKSSAYALHAAPLPIADTIYLDPNYAAAIEELTGQHQGRVHKIATNVLAQIFHQTV